MSIPQGAGVSTSRSGETIRAQQAVAIRPVTGKDVVGGRIHERTRRVTCSELMTSELTQANSMLRMIHASAAVL